MRCLVTGSKGLLGTELVEWLRARGEEAVGWDLPEHDVTDVEQTINGIHKVGPELIYHLAAWTDVDGCEDDKAKATAVNFQGTWAVALGAEEARCRMVYLSTDYVFDGRSPRPYREKDKPNPLSNYGRSKLMGEKAVRQTCSRSYVVRTSWLYGRHGRNFIDTILRKAKEQGRLEVVADQFGSPTLASDLCEPLWNLGKSERFGVYHLANSGQCSWHELAARAVELAGIECEVVPIDTASSRRSAPRPRFSVLENRNYRRRFGAELRSWQDALKEYLG